VDSTKGREALQRELERPESWAITNCTKLHKSKGRILLVGWGNPGYTYNPWDEIAGEQHLRRRSGVLG